MEKIYKCPECGEQKNLRFDYDYLKQHRPINRVWCKSCGNIFDGDMLASDLPTKPGFVERRMAQGKANNDKMWDSIYNEYKGVSDLHDFVDWLKTNYIVPEPIHK